MILQPDQRKRFVKLLDALTMFVNERLGVVSPHALRLGPGFEIDVDAQSEVMRELWKNTELIDEFVELNPAGLGRRDLAEVAAWRQGITGYHTVARDDDGQLVFLTGDYVFDVRGISREIDDMLMAVPSLVQTMLVPFDGRICYTIAIAEMPVEIGPNMRANIASEIAEAVSAGRRVSSARDFAEAAAAVERKREEDEVERVISEAEGVLAASVQMEGTHRGALAGLTEEERDRALREREASFGEEGDLSWFDDPVYTVGQVARRGSPKFGCAELLEAMKKDELLEMAEDLEITGASGLKKSELAEAITGALQSDELALVGAAETLPSTWINVVREIIDAGGRLHLPEEKVTFENTMPPHEPLVFLYHTKSCFVYVIPDELLDGLRELNWDVLAERAELREDIRDLASAAVELRGLVPLAEFVDDCRSLHPELGEDDEIIFLLTQAALSTPLFTLFTTGDDAFLVDNDLLEAYLDEHEDEVDLVEEALFHGPLTGPLEGLYEAQGDKPPRPIDAEILEFPLAMLWRETLPAARELRDWLDANVPDGRDDYTFADIVMGELLSRVKWGIVGTDTAVEYLELLEDFGLSVDDGHLQQFLDLLMAFLNTQPIWPNNGWAPAELAGMNPPRR